MKLFQDQKKKKEEKFLNVFFAPNYEEKKC